MVDVFELLAEPNRRRILQIVWDGPRPAGEIARHFEMTFGAVSQHLQKLSGSGILQVEKAGRSRLYRVRKESLGPLAKALEAMWSEALYRLKNEAEGEALSLARSARTKKGHSKGEGR